MAYCYPVPSASHFNPQLQSICMVRSPKSIGVAVRPPLGNAPDKIGNRYFNASIVTKPPSTA
ncbi:MAG: hypothetical protein EWV58_12595 [Microcystis aeruginosa Ma_MB_F_20061100_S19]|nr:MAG: hypothetical protein EWV59_05900 [Microcystis aeruginosa Ma_MB_F_20061100_S19D]TRU14131.1 MAG: hypothetical protein EWV58_12595 [Microcystis aeruginosa Ma_MB_F_20061100_S19]